MDAVGPLVGEPLALDLVSTHPMVRGEVADLLVTPKRLADRLSLQADRLALVARHQRRHRSP